MHDGPAARRPRRAVALHVRSVDLLGRTSRDQFGRTSLVDAARRAISLGEPTAITLAEPTAISLAEPRAISYAGPSQARRSFAISGTITGATPGGVTISVSGPATASAITDGVGRYTIRGLSGGSYTVTPSKPGYTFSPASTDVTVSGGSTTGQDFRICSADHWCWEYPMPQGNDLFDLWGSGATDVCGLERHDPALGWRQVERRLTRADERAVRGVGQQRERRLDRRRAWSHPALGRRELVGFSERHVRHAARSVGEWRERRLGRRRHHRPLGRDRLDQPLRFDPGEPPRSLGRLALRRMGKPVR